MPKLLLSAALVATIVLTSSHEASARRRCYRQWAPAYQSYSYAAPAPAVAGQNPGGYSYRSYSYDTAAPSAVYRAPSPPVYQSYQPLAPSQSHFFRADRKAHSLSWYRTQ